MKKFEDFRNSINPKFYDEFESLVKQSLQNTNIPNTSEDAGKFAATIIGLSMNAALSMLEGYHEWLHKQDTR